MNRYLCIHGHFYQPPRENPWLEEVELQDSAYPYHDWNDRITAECYAPNMASRILDADKKIVDIGNNYAKISFNFGPTLLSWMEKHRPETYEAVIEADRLSQERFSGHGSALAQVYSHMIMPLANSRDKRTQVVWGIRDFETRFGRAPEGMWLAETAVDLETLGIMADCGIKFTILAPRQARRVRKLGEERWRDVSRGRVDPKMPYLCKLASGRTITLFFFDGPISNDIAFGDLLNSGDNFAMRLLSAFADRDEPQLVHVATDGESYGHHHRFGDMALAYALHHIESNNLAKLTNYGEYLEQYPPANEVEIFENTSWSCVHGIERWRSNCGCHSGMHPEWNQEWRGPLREAMNWLRDNAAGVFEREMASCVSAPWQVREDYIEVVLDRSVQNVDSFLAHYAIRDLSQEEQIRVLKLLEMQRHAMLMFTSCGWFFDEISGIETVQVIQYASRVMQLAREITGEDLESGYLKLLEQAPSNRSEFATGVQVWDAYVKPATIDLLRVAAHYAVSSLFEEYPETTKIFSYTASSEMYDIYEAGIQRLAVGRARLRSEITREENPIAFAVLHLGDHNILGGVRDYMGDDSFSSMREEIKEAFQKSDIPEIIRLMDTDFQTHNYSLWHLFRDEQRKVLDQILDSTLREIESSFRQVYEHHYPIMQMMREIKIPLPKVFSTTAEFIINMDIRSALESDEFDLERLEKLAEEATRWSFKLDKVTLGFVATQKIDSLLERLSRTPQDMAFLESIGTAVKLLKDLPLELNLWQAQNIYFAIRKQIQGEIEAKAQSGDRNAERWIAHFKRLGDYLYVRSA